MHVVVTADRIGDRDPVAATAALARAWRAAAPHDRVSALPGGGGGPGTAAAGAAGRPAPGTAWVDAAACTGPDSAGVGRRLADLAGGGVERVVVALGGAPGHDAGLAAMLALGLPDPDGAVASAARGAALRPGDLDGLPSVARRLATTDLIAGYDDDAPLLGAPATAGPAQAERRTRWLQALVQAVPGLPAVRRDLLSGQARSAADLARAPGSGAGGGLGFGLALLGARLLPAAAVVADAVGLAEQVHGCELVVVGVDVLDWRTAATGVVEQAATVAARDGLPVVVLASRVLLGRRDLAGVGLAGAYGLRDGLDVPGLAARVAHTWSPAR